MKNKPPYFSRSGLNLIWKRICARASILTYVKENNDFKTKIGYQCVFMEQDAWMSNRCMESVRPLHSLCKGKELLNRIHMLLALMDFRN
jgi:hypothetical protein